MKKKPKYRLVLVNVTGTKLRFLIPSLLYIPYDDETVIGLIVWKYLIGVGYSKGGYGVCERFKQFRNE